MKNVFGEVDKYEVERYKNPNMMRPKNPLIMDARF